ncbi:MAG: accessory factor UbiK family protein [Pacificimonas sp.]|jgi:BMFP domain-containing protein YqiC|nr:accessory factor UbiK family protein [Pacificimonas sp.]
MQSQNRFLDDISRLATGAAGTMAGMGREVEQRFKDRMREMITDMDLVTREEFEAVKEMAANARAEADALRQRLDALEATSAPKAKAAKVKPKPKTD